MGLKRRLQEVKDRVEQLKAQGMNRRDRDAVIKAESSGDQAALSTLGISEGSAPSAGASAGSAAVEDTRGDSKFRVKDDMELVGQTAAGQTDTVDVSGQKLNPGEWLLYNDATGELYKTSKWHTLNENRNYLVDAEGKRKRIAGYISRSANKVEEGEDQTYEYSLHSKASPGDTWLVTDYNEETPVPGTAEFQERMESTFYNVVLAQAMHQRYEVGEDGRASRVEGFAGTKFGTYGSISARDYIALGKPGSVGNMSMGAYSDMEDDELLRQGLLIGQDTKDRSHGVEKALNKIGGALLGDKNFGHEFMRVAGDATKVPILGSVVGLVSRPIMAYEASRDAGYSSGRAGKEAGKAGLDAAQSFLIDAAVVAATIASVFAAPFTGGASLVVAGAAIGAAYGTVGGALKQGLHTTLYGGYEESELWNAMGEGAAVGAVSGAFQGIGKAGAMAATGTAAAKTASYLGSGYAQVGKSALQNYALAYSKGGEYRKNADKALVYGLAGAAIQFSGVHDFSEDLTAPYRNPFMAEYVAGAGDQFSFGNAWSAFREHAATNSWLSPIVSRGTKSREFLQTVRASVGKQYDAVGLLQSGNSSNVLQEIIDRNEWRGLSGTLNDIGGWRQPIAYAQGQANAAPPAASLAASYTRAPSWSWAQDQVSPRGAPRTSPPPPGALSSAYEAPWRGTYQERIDGTSPPLGMVAPQYYR